MRPVAGKGFVARPQGRETVLVPVRSSVADFERVFLLNRVAGFLWQQLDGTRDRDALVALVREKFAVPDGHDVGADVDRFLREALERGLATHP